MAEHDEGTSVSPNHCGDCGAYLATDHDIAKHRKWHLDLHEILSAIGRKAEHADSMTRVIGGSQ